MKEESAEERLRRRAYERGCQRLKKRIEGLWGRREVAKIPHLLCSQELFLNPSHRVKYSCVPARTGCGAEVGASHALF